MKTWPCEHISSCGSLGPYKNNWVYGKGNSIIMLHMAEMFCKYCGAERPKPVKKLAEILENEWRKPDDVLTCFQHQAQASVDAVFVVIDETKQDFACVHREQIKEAIREKLL